jgi:hypothetical protein
MLLSMLLINYIIAIKRLNQRSKSVKEKLKNGNRSSFLTISGWCDLNRAVAVMPMRLKGALLAQPLRITCPL